MRQRIILILYCTHEIVSNPMTKRKSSKSAQQAQNKSMQYKIAAVVIFLVGGVILIMTATAENTATATIQSQKLDPTDYASNFADDTDHVLIDVRTPEEFGAGHIAGAINIPVQQLEQRLSEVPSDKEIVVYCRSGNRSATASQILTREGYDIVYDMGGIVAWQQAGLPIE